MREHISAEVILLERHGEREDGRLKTVGKGTELEISTYTFMEELPFQRLVDDPGTNTPVSKSLHFLSASSPLQSVTLQESLHDDQDFIFRD